MSTTIRALHLAAVVAPPRLVITVGIWAAVYCSASASLLAIDGPTASIVSSIVSLVAAIVVALLNGSRERRRLERDNRLLEVQVRERENEIRRLKESGYDVEDVEEPPQPRLRSKRRRQGRERS